MISTEAALAALEEAGAPERAPGLAAHHGVERVYLGTPNTTIDTLARGWRDALGTDLEARVALARGLWDSDVFEARIAAAKLFTQARIRPDDSAVWAEILRWMPMLDCLAIADQVAQAGARRLVAEPDRLAEVEGWATQEAPLIRRAMLGFTLPWAKLAVPKPADIALRERILATAGDLANDSTWELQRMLGTWLTILARHDKARAAAFVAAHGAAMRPSVAKQVARASAG